MANEDADGLRERFWRELRDVRTGMLGLAREDEGHAQPMTAQFEGKAGPLWFFAHKHSPLVQAVEDSHPAVFHYVSGKHELYACVHGEVAAAEDAAAIDRFWCAEVARWYPGGRQDADLALLCFKPSSAQIWLAAEGPQPSLLGFGRDHEGPRDIHAEVRL
jgi:general stress protein 26